MVRWVSSGEDRWLYYLQPRPGLAAIGVEPETLLFEGKRIGNRLFGTPMIAPAAFFSMLIHLPFGC